MCLFLSVVSKGDGCPIYFDGKKRKLIVRGKLRDSAGLSTIDDPDSHSQICAYFGLDCDKVNKYEFLPLNKQFITDQINIREGRWDDSRDVRRALMDLDCQPLCPPELTLRPIHNPLKDPQTQITQKDKDLLRVWDSVRSSVGSSVWDSVGNSVWDSVGDSVWDSVWDSVGSSVWDSVGNSVWNSVRNSVWNSVRDSVRDLVKAYVGSFFTLPQWKGSKHKKGKYPFQAAVDLWNRNLLPSFDGETWRLHTGPDAKIVWEWKAKQ